MRLRGGLALGIAVLTVPAGALALTVDPGGPWRVGEGEDLVLRPVVSGAVGTVAWAWDLDGDGVFDDGSEDTATFSAVGIDGPSDGFTVGVVVADDVDQTLVEIPVDVTNTGPQFQNVPDPHAVVGRPWTWTPLVTDAGGDSFELSVDTDTLPLGMTWDALLLTFTWIPNEGHLQQGDPLGHYSFRVTAEDEDRGRTNYEVALTVIRNTAPPVPPIAYPDGTEEVRTARPTIILNNVDDPDGDTVTYWLQLDSDPCFCSPEVQESGAIVEGDFATEWHVPRPLDVEVGAEPKTYYVQRWSNDGIEDSAQELSLFNVAVSEGGGDADSDADADADSDADADGDGDGGRDRGGCSVTPAASAGSSLALALAALGLALALRRRR